MQNVRVTAYGKNESYEYLAIEGYKPKGWAVKQSTYKITVEMRYSLSDEINPESIKNFDNKTGTPEIKKKTKKTVTKIHTFAIKGIYGGKHKNLQKNLSKEYPKHVGMWEAKDSLTLEDTEKLSVIWTEITKVNIRRMR